MATPEELEAIVDEIAAGGVQSATVDGQSVTAIDPLKLQEIADRRRAETAAETANPHNLLRSGRAVFRGPSE